jgi:hypothetical protein
VTQPEFELFPEVELLPVFELFPFELDFPGGGAKENPFPCDTFPCDTFPCEVPLELVFTGLFFITLLMTTYSNVDINHFAFPKRKVHVICINHRFERLILLL